MKCKNFILGALAALSIFVFFPTCEIGLGESVDTEPPTGSISSPGVNAVIRDAFLLQGQWHDEAGIKQVAVELKYNSEGNNKGKKYSYDATINKDNTWTCKIDPESKTQPLVDGTYLATIVIYDNGGHQTKLERSYILDNTPPVIVLQRPSSILSSSASDTDTYGQKFTIQGQAADDNNLNKIEVEIYSDEECTEDFLLKTITLNNVPLAINNDVASYVSGDTEKESDYSKIYFADEAYQDLNDMNASEASKTRYCKIIAYDGAQRYPAKGEEKDDDSTGNKQTNYYLYDDISGSILSTYKVNELYAMFNGTYASSDSSRSVATTTSSILEQLEDKAQTVAKFNLNPKNNPTFSVSGKDQLTDGWTTNDAYNISSGSQVVVEVSPGLDGISLNKDSLKVYFVEYNATTKKVESVKFYPVTERQAYGSGYKFITTINSSYLGDDNTSKTKIGSNYIFGVEGWDKSNGDEAVGNTIIASGKGYGFHLASSGVAPTLNPKFEISENGTAWTEVTDTILYLKAGTYVKVSGTVSVEEGTPDFSLLFGDTDSGASLTAIENSENNFSFTKKFEPNAFGTKTSQRQITVKAWQDKLTTSKTYTVYYDLEAPTISISEVKPIACKYTGEAGTIDGKQYLNGDNVSIKLTISDNDSVYTASDDATDEEKSKNPKIEIEDSTGKIISNTNVTTLINFVWDNIPTTQLADGPITIRVTAYDRAGNKKEITNNNFEVDQDTDKPVILPNSASQLTFTADSEDLPASKNKFASGSQLILKLIDDDGLASITPWLGTNATNLVEKSAFSLPVSSTSETYTYNLPTDVGFHTLRFKLTDSNGKSTYVPSETGCFFVKITAGAPTIQEVKSVVKDGTGAELDAIYTKGDTSDTARYFENKVNFDSEYTKFNIYRSTDNTNFTAIASDIEEDGTSTIENEHGSLAKVSGTWVYTDTLHRPAATTTYYYYVAGVDGTDEEKSNKKNVTCKVDKEVPVVVLSALPGASDTKATSYIFSATSKDTGGSGIEKIVLTITDKTDESKTMTLTEEGQGAAIASLSKTVTYANEEVFTGSDGKALEGYKKITLKAIDTAGNESAKFTFDGNTELTSTEFLYDKAKPTLSVTSDLREYMPNEGYTISGSVSDSYSIKSLKITETFTPKDTTASKVEKTADIIADVGSSTVPAQTFADFQLPLDYTSGTNLDDGTYSYSITLTDKKGNEDTITFASIVDKTAPTVTITTPETDDSYKAENAISGKTFQFEGDLEEDNSLSGVYYAIVANGAAAPSVPTADVTTAEAWENKGFTKVTNFGTTNWKTKKNFRVKGSDPDSAYPDSLEEGSQYKIIVYAVDKAGNVGHTKGASKAERSFDVDMAKPDIKLTPLANTILNINTTEDQDGKKGEFYIQGTSTDSLGLEKVEITYISDAQKEADEDAQTITFSATNGALSSDNSWKQKFVYGSEATASNGSIKLTDGIYTFNIKATDLIGKTKELDEIVLTVDTKMPDIKTSSLKLDGSTYSSTKYYESKALELIVNVEDGSAGSGISKVQVATKNASGNKVYKSCSLTDNSTVEWTATVQFYNEGDNELYITAKDKAGNEIETGSPITVKVDTTAPELELDKYQIGNGSVLDAASTIYINGTSTLTLYGTYSDAQSGVRELSFSGTKNNDQPADGNVLYSIKTTADSAASDYDTFGNITNKLKIQSWKAVFTNGTDGIIETGDWKVKGRNNAGSSGVPTEKNLFTLNKDVTKPVLKNISLATDNDDYSVYKKTEEGIVYYYANNQTGKFKISGLAEDNRGTEGPASGVDKVKITIVNTAVPTKKIEKEESSVNFYDILLADTDAEGNVTAYWTEGATATVTVFDKAGNECQQPTVLNIKFDTEGPAGVHSIDTSGKDLFFRLGENDNDDIDRSNSDWNGGSASTVKIDQDVGGKYSTTTYGNAQTVTVRGTFNDTGSGVEKIYYYIASSKADANGVTVENFRTKTSNYFTPIVETSKETVEQQAKRRVFYTDTLNNGSLYNPDSTGTEKYNTKITDINVKDASTKRYYTSITSTFKATIPGFTPNESNYLVLIAVDNVGNAKVDGMKLVTQEEGEPSASLKTYSNYLINVDTTVPDVPSLSGYKLNKYIKPSDDNQKITITGTATDNLSGVASLVVKINNGNKEIKKDITTFGTIKTISSGKVIKTSDDKYNIVQTNAQNEETVIEEDIGEEYKDVTELSSKNTWWKAEIKNTAFAGVGVSSGSNIVVELEAKDNAGLSKTYTVGTVVVDTEGPTVKINKVPNAGTAKIGSEDVPLVNGASLTIEGSATDSASGLKANTALNLYYTTKDSPSAPTNDTISETASDVGTKWIKYNPAEGLGGTQGNTWEFKIDTTQLKDNTVTYFSVSSEDDVGNIGYSTPYKVKINQDSDRPIITLSNLELATTSGATTYLKSTKTLYLTVTDDDGVSKIEYKKTGDSDFVLYSNGVTNLAEGPNTVQFKITDGAGGVFTSGAADTTVAGNTISHQPKITDGTTTISKALSFNVVTETPHIEKVQYSYYDSESTATTEEEKWSAYADTLRTLGGKYTKLKLKISASSAQSIASITGTYHGSSDVAVTFNCKDNNHNDINLHDWESGAIALTSAANFEGRQTIDIVVSDIVTPTPMTTEKSYSISIDNKAPELSISKPDAGKQLSRDQTVRGEIKNESDPKLYYAVSRYAATAADVQPDSNTDKRMGGENNTVVLATKWTEIEHYDDAGTWYVYFDGTDSTSEEDHTEKFATYLTEEYLNLTTKQNILDNKYDEIPAVYFWIKAEDDCGNKTILHRQYDIDPYGERPEVTITYPVDVLKKDSTTEYEAPTLGGTIRMTGTATDNNEAKYVWVQIDKDSTVGFSKDELKFLKDNGYPIGQISTNKPLASVPASLDDGADAAADYGIMVPVSGSSWALNLNANGEFDPESDKARLTIRVYATDEDVDANSKKTIHKSKVKTQVIYIDADAPYSENLKLVQYTTGDTIGAQKTYSDGVSVKGIWYLTGNYIDASSGIKEIKYKAENQTEKTVIASGGDSYTSSSDSNLWFKPIKEDGTDYNKETDSTYTGKINYKFSIPLGNEAGVGKSKAKLKVTENKTSGAISIEPEYNVVYDNQPPVLTTSGNDSFIKLNTKVQNSSGFYTFGAIASEDKVGEVAQTGVERIAFYFTRDLEYSLSELNSDTYAKHTGEKDSKTNDLFDVMIYHSNLENDSTYDDVNTGNMIVNYKGKSEASNPTLVFEDGIYWHKLSGNITSNAFTYTGTKKPNIHPKGLVKIDGAIYLINTVSSNTVGINGSFEDKTDVTAYFAVCNVIDNGGEKNGSSTDYSDSTKAYGYGYYQTRQTDDGDLITETFNNQGTQWIFDAAINSKNLPDGPITLHMVAFDKAGNHSTWESTGFVVSNNAPRIAGMKIGTDEDGNGTVEESEFITTYSGRYEKGYENGDTERPVNEATFPATNSSNQTTVLTVKGYTEVKPELVGGNGKIYYTYSAAPVTAGTVGTAKTIIDNDNKIEIATGTTDTIATLIRPIKLLLEHFIGTEDGKDNKVIPEGINKFTFNFGDSTPGVTKTSVPNNATLNVYLNVALREEEKAKNWILPFYWTSSTDNSLFKQSKELGHIEIAREWALSSGYSAADDELDSDPKVSGKIKIEGIAKDNSLLKEIKVKFGTAMSTTGGIGTTDETIATYNEGSWTIAEELTDEGEIGTKGWAAEIKHATYKDLMDTGIITAYPEENGITKKATDEVPYTTQTYGHVVHWILYLDTEKISGVTAANVTVTATATDRGTPKWKSDESKAVYTANDAEVTGKVGDNLPFSGTVKVTVSNNSKTATVGNLTGSYRMDVVPYIMGVSTRLDQAYSSKPSVFNRSAQGYYPVQRSKTGDAQECEIYGLNLAGDTAEITFNGTSVGTKANEKLTPATFETVDKYSYDSLKFNVPTTANSGDIEVTVGSLKSLNNKNSNDEGYNSEANDTNNNNLNDDRRVWVWGMNDVLTGVSTVRYPSFRIGKDANQTVGFVYDRGGDSVYYYRKNGTSNSTNTRLDYSYSQWFATACAIDSSGHIYAGAQNGDSAARGNMPTHNSYANYKFYALADMVSSNMNFGYSKGYNAVALESCIGLDESTFFAERIKNPKIATLGSNKTKMYTVYFDSSSPRIVFRYGEASKENDTEIKFESYGIVNRENSSAANAQIIDRSSNVGEYAAVGVIPTGVTGAGTAVVCWNSGNALKYKYNTDPTSNTWSAEKIIDSDYAGEYCDLAVDAAGGIHIAYYRAGNKLKYAYLSSYDDTTPDVCMVDSYLSVGEHISIETSTKTLPYKEGNEDKTRYVPYISYYSSAIGMAKVAWPVTVSSTGHFTDGVTNDRFTGDWEVQVLPTSLATKLLTYTIGVGEKTNGLKDGETDIQSVMLGYGTKNGLQTALLY